MICKSTAILNCFKCFLISLQVFLGLKQMSVKKMLDRFRADKSSGAQVHTLLDSLRSDQWWVFYS